MSILETITGKKKVRLNRASRRMMLRKERPMSQGAYDRKVRAAQAMDRLLAKKK